MTQQLQEIRGQRTFEVLLRAPESHRRYTLSLFALGTHVRELVGFHIDDFFKFLAKEIYAQNLTITNIIKLRGEFPCQKTFRNTLLEIIL